MQLRLVMATIEQIVLLGLMMKPIVKKRDKNISLLLQLVRLYWSLPKDQEAIRWIKTNRWWICKIGALITRLQCTLYGVRLLNDDIFAEEDKYQDEIEKMIEDWRVRKVLNWWLQFASISKPASLLVKGVKLPVSYSLFNHSDDSLGWTNEKTPWIKRAWISRSWELCPFCLSRRHVQAFCTDGIC